MIVYIANDEDILKLIIIIGKKLSHYVGARWALEPTTHKTKFYLNHTFQAQNYHFLSQLYIAQISCNILDVGIF